MWITDIVIKCIPDTIFLKCMYRIVTGKRLNLKKPRTFNEKLQWLKLHNRKSIYTMMVDKYEAKEFIANRVGKEYIIPTLGVWNKFEEIDFNSLPNQFILKCTHDSGGLVICKDKSKLAQQSVRKKINNCLQKNYYYKYREWPYKNVKPRIIAETLLQNKTGEEIKDYKFHCFDGKVKILYVTSDRFSGKELKADYFDDQFEKLDIQWELPNSNYKIEKPQNFELMKSIAQKLSSDIPTLRVDFYEVNGKVYVGELTFFDGSGFAEISGNWDKILGSYIELY